MTLPNGRVTAKPVNAPDPLAYGDGVMSVGLFPNGIVVFRKGGPGEIRADGSLAMKFPWDRGHASGRLVITGRRLDAAAPPLRADVPEFYADGGFLPTRLIFPTVGCWEVTGTVGRSQLTFVTQVVRE
ncbi:MAG TPA: hypothetical protein VFM06_07530 [Candidatus Limnocylindria bacterium]|nr:hypothetical protein [Candidatus Limnocylindria bacterium]